jgi:hypothetical protein
VGQRDLLRSGKRQELQVQYGTGIADSTETSRLYRDIHFRAQLHLDPLGDAT